MAELRWKGAGCRSAKKSKIECVRILLLLVLTAGIGSSQLPSHYIAIDLPEEVRSEGVFIRYVLAGEELGGWVQPRPGISAYIIGTGSAAGIKAVLYAPGCAIQTLDIVLSNSSNPRFAFLCRQLGNVEIAGKLVQTERLGRHEVKVQAKYIGRWVQQFLGLGDIRVSIPVGDVADLSAHNRFRLTIPDFARDRPGEIRLWAKDKASGDDVAQLSPGLKIQSAYPAETIFAPCAARGALVLIRRDVLLHDPNDPCDR
jgi:hypothetical protein